MTGQFEPSSKELQSLSMTSTLISGKLTSPASPGSAGNKLAISGVVHKAFIDVNEEGTEARERPGL